HDGSLGDDKLRVADAAARARGTQALLETERAAEPVDRLLHVLVDENGDHRRPRCGAVGDHEPPPVDVVAMWKEIRFFSHARFTTAPFAPSGSIAAVTYPAGRASHRCAAA